MIWFFFYMRVCDELMFSLKIAHAVRMHFHMEIPKYMYQIFSDLTNHFNVLVICASLLGHPFSVYVVWVEILIWWQMIAAENLLSERKNEQEGSLAFAVTSNMHHEYIEYSIRWNNPKWFIYSKYKQKENFS